MSSTGNNASREQWHSLFNAALNGTMTNAEHDQLCELLRESREARQLWFVYNDNEIGLCELDPLAGPPARSSSTPTRTRRSPLPICLGVIAVAVLVIAVIWIWNLVSPGTNHEVAHRAKTDSDPSARPARSTEIAESEVARVPLLLEEPDPLEASERMGLEWPDPLEEPGPLEASEPMVESETTEEVVPTEESEVLEESVPNRHKEWRNISAAVAHADMLYVVDSGHLYEVSPMDGSRRIVGDDDWQNCAAMGAARGHLYIVSDNQLYEVNPTTGARRSLGKPDWAETEAIVTLDDKLYIVAGGLLHRVNPSDGSREVLHNKNDSTNHPRKPKH